MEGIVTLCIVYALTAVMGGGSFWQQSMLQSVGVKQYSFIPSVLYNMAWNEWYLVYGGVVLVFNTVSRYFWNINNYRDDLADSCVVLRMSCKHAVPVANKRVLLCLVS